MLALLLLSSLTQVPLPGQGVPTPYWQQTVHYDIRARLDEPTGVLGGTEQVEYVNHSPDTLRSFALHLYLNAFRPGSRWAAADSVEQRHRFNDLPDPEFGFNHVRDVRIQGQPVTPIFPFAPDSTIVRFVLPAALAPGDSMSVTMNWDARPSTLPRRQGRRRRRFDFAQWYPRVVVYDRFGWEEHPLYPAGEFYGEFGTFLVDLDLPADQVMGATGVPVCGDPGWERANAVPDRPIDYQRDWYGNAASPAMQARCAAAVAAGRKRIIWYAGDVHHFAMSLNPDYRYEEGRQGSAVVRVLYQPGDETSWGGGVAVQRTETALAWLGQLFGPFPWPQLTNVHRIEGGGTEFPMMIHDGSASQGLIVHEGGHNYLMGILANNEWKEGWLDEGFTSFQSAWFQEAAGHDPGWFGDEAYILDLDLDGWSEPTSLVSEDYRDFYTYNLMIYTRGQLFLWELRSIVGDSVMRQILHTYYQRWQFKHVDEQKFMAVAEEVSHQDLSVFFAQFLHTTELYDYAVGRVQRGRGAGGQGSSDSTGWVTKVEVIRQAPGMIPVDVMVVSDRDTSVVRTDGLAERTWVTVPTRGKPKAVVLDPWIRTHDWNMLNNDRKLGFTLDKHRTETKLDTYFSTPSARDRRVDLWAPTAWYTQAGGVLAGLRMRSNYLGRFAENEAWFGYNTELGGSNPAGLSDWHLFLRIKNPVALRAPRTTEKLEFTRFEGRVGVLAAVEHQTLGHLAYGPTTHWGASLQWLSVYDMRYLDSRLYQDAGTVEGQVYVRSEERKGLWTLGGNLSAGGGYTYSNQGSGLSTDNRYDAALYFRGSAEATARRPLGKRFGLSFRGFAGFAESGDSVVTQRQIFLAGADPYVQIDNPYLRSLGAPLAGADFHYQTPGGASLRGLNPHTYANTALALGAGVGWTPVNRRGGHLFNRVSASAFGDAAYANGSLSSDNSLHLAGDAGVGLLASHRIGQTSFVTRFDFPVYVSRPDLGVDGSYPGEEFRFRWVFSFQTAW